MNSSVLTLLTDLLLLPRLETDLGSLTRVAARGQAATKEQRREVGRLDSERWETIVAMNTLGPGYKDTSRSFFSVGSTSGRGPFTHIRLNIFPDGGVARLRVYGVSVPRLTPSLLSSPLDLISARQTDTLQPETRFKFLPLRESILDGSGSC